MRQQTECYFLRPSHDLKPGAKQRIHGVVWSSVSVLSFLYHTASIFDSNLFGWSQQKTFVLLIAKLLYSCQRAVIFKVTFISLHNFNMLCRWTENKGGVDERRGKKCPGQRLEQKRQHCPSDRARSPNFVVTGFTSLWYSILLILPFVPVHPSFISPVIVETLFMVGLNHVHTPSVSRELHYGHFTP